MRYDLGIALSSAAIGDAYFCSNMPEEATDSYKEAIRYPASPSENNHYKEMTILKLIQVLILTQRTEEAEKYRKILSESKSIQTHQTLQFLTLATDVSYYIQKNDLRNANNCLRKQSKSTFRTGNLIIAPPTIICKDDITKQQGTTILHYEVRKECNLLK